ncbi:HD domain-containing protein [[Clostridium] polysaccharolyticum]|uniref:HD domain-containing protein n=2 Tax=[Clostridium] polysaccharolyticum TaxID=29364 RepID=A0A1I0E7I0_9FIRM|nr:HD domain-containing protein [[Clostridium] polysaccharolyticum]
MYEHNYESEEYFNENDHQANRVTSYFIYVMTVVFSILFLLTHLKIIHTPAKALLLPFILTLFFNVILIFLRLLKASGNFTKYYCLIVTEVIIGILSTQARSGIFMTYIIAPLVSCIYFDKILTRRIAFFGYFMMIAGLAFRANAVVDSSLTTFSSLTWFITYGINFSFEYMILSLICYAIAFRSRNLLMNVFSRKKKIDFMQQQMIYSFANLIESRDNVTGQHVKRTSAYVRLIAEELKYNGFYADELNDTALEYICLAAPIHDIGKLKIPDSILQKPGILTDLEYDYIKNHTVRGEEIIERTMTNLEDDDFVHYAKNVARYHHEHWDGTGYPEGLSGRNIPLCARIMAVADVFDALVTKRSYKESFSLEDAFKQLEKGSGTQFEPLIVELFVNQKEVVKQMYNDIT